MYIKHLFSLLSLNHWAYLVKFQLTSIQEIESVRQWTTFKTLMSKAKKQGTAHTTNRTKSKKDLD